MTTDNGSYMICGMSLFFPIALFEGPLQASATITVFYQVLFACAKISDQGVNDAYSKAHFQNKSTIEHFAFIRQEKRFI